MNKEVSFIFLRVEWLHDFHDEPILIYSETDELRYEIRKIEMFRDGKVCFATKETETGDTILSELPLPSFDDIRSDPQFIPSIITEEEFFEIWNKYVMGI